MKSSKSVGLVSSFASLIIIATLLAACTWPSPTVTPTPDRIVLTGLVYDANDGLTHPISGALVSGYLSGCSVPVGRVCQTHSGPDGHYELDLCGIYGLLCKNVDLQVEATGYMTSTQAALTADLLADPERDFALAPLDPTPTPQPAAYSGNR